MWIEREFQNYIKRLAGERPALVLTGARQTGKTSLLRHLFPKHGFVSLDLPSIAEEAETQGTSFLARYPAPLIVDEIQYAPGLLRYLKIAIDSNRELRNQFLITGSQKFALLKGVQESLAGRAAIVELEALSLHEISQGTPQSATSAMLRGGYPELWVPPSIDHVSFYRSYLASYLERDLKVIINVTQLRDFERFMRACALRSGALLNKSDLGRDVGVSLPTITEWLNALVASGVVVLLEPYFNNVSRSIAKSPKLYFSDTGFLCYLLNLHSETRLSESTAIGHLFETFVFSELRRRLLATQGQWNIYFYRDRGVEVDFLVIKDNVVNLVECKWTESPSDKDTIGMRKVHAALPKTQFGKSLIVSRSNNRAKISDHIETVPLAELFEAIQ